MHDSAILLDFGASRVKSVLWSHREGRPLSRCECVAPGLLRGPCGEVEGEPEHYWQALEATAGQLASSNPTVQDIWLCAEMHGFMLADNATGQPITRDISWQDQRASYRSTGDPSEFNELLSGLGPLLMRHAGMRSRPGLPAINLASLRAQLGGVGHIRFLTLVDWLMLRGGDPAARCHRTLAAGTGLYSLESASWSKDLLGLVLDDPGSVAMPALQGDQYALIGTINLAGRAMRVWGGLGDLQAAAYGAGFPHASSVLVNLGTGSQVMALTTTRVENVEVRPCAQGEIANAITHIPSGRALNTFASFVNACCSAGGGQPVFWRLFGKLQADEVLAAEPTFDLNVFDSAWRYRAGGSITHINESVFSLDWFMNTLAKSWLVQYAQALSEMAAIVPGNTFLLAGGMSRRAAFIAPVLESLLGRRAVSVPLRTGEETLDGLLALAEISH